jgi:mRNA interferase YafQ
MLRPVYSRRFERDWKRSRRRGKDLEKLRYVIRQLVLEIPLDSRYHDHPLVGIYKGRRECHIEPDWLLIYKRDQDMVLFERTGTHADLF